MKITFLNFEYIWGKKLIRIEVINYKNRWMQNNTCFLIRLSYFHIVFIPTPS